MMGHSWVRLSLPPVRSGCWAGVVTSHWHSCSGPPVGKEYLGRHLLWVPFRLPWPWPWSSSCPLSSKPWICCCPDLSPPSSTLLGQTWQVKEQPRAQWTPSQCELGRKHRMGGSRRRDHSMGTQAQVFTDRPSASKNVTLMAPERCMGYMEGPPVGGTVPGRGQTGEGICACEGQA